MDSFALLLLALCTLGVFGLTAWIWLSNVSESEDLLAFQVMQAPPRERRRAGKLCAVIH